MGINYLMDLAKCVGGAQFLGLAQKRFTDLMSCIFPICFKKTFNSFSCSTIHNAADGDNTICDRTYSHGLKSKYQIRCMSCSLQVSGFVLLFPFEPPGYFDRLPKFSIDVILMRQNQQKNEIQIINLERLYGL